MKREEIRTALIGAMPGQGMVRIERMSDLIHFGISVHRSALKLRAKKPERIKHRIFRSLYAKRFEEALETMDAIRGETSFFMNLNNAKALHDGYRALTRNAAIDPMDLKRWFAHVWKIGRSERQGAHFDDKGEIVLPADETPLFSSLVAHLLEAGELEGLLPKKK